MLIECTLKREAPIVVPIGNEKYHFEPDAKGRKVAEVWIESHIESFLAVSHLYRKLEDEAPADEPRAEKPGAVTPGVDKLDRKGVMDTLRDRGIRFKATETTEALRLKLAEAGSPPKAA